MFIVNRTRDYRSVPFEKLNLEDVFRFDGRLLMKVSKELPDITDVPNAYDFSSKRLTSISGDTETRPVHAELVLYPSQSES